jgi:hypothetical protein
MHKRPRRRLLERLDEDMEVVPEPLADLLDVLKTEPEEGDEVDGRNLVAEDDGHFMDGGGERATDADFSRGTQLEVVVSDLRPAFATDGEGDGRVLRNARRRISSGQNMGLAMHERKRRRAHVESANERTSIVVVGDDGSSRGEELQRRPDMLRLRRLLLLVVPEEELDEPLWRTLFVVMEDMNELAEDLKGGPVDLDDLVLEESVDDGEGVRSAEVLGLETFGKGRKAEAGGLTDVRAFVGGERVVQGDLDRRKGKAMSARVYRRKVKKKGKTDELISDDLLRNHLKQLTHRQRSLSPNPKRLIEPHPDDLRHKLLCDHIISLQHLALCHRRNEVHRQQPPVRCLERQLVLERVVPKLEPIVRSGRGPFGFVWIGPVVDWRGVWRVELVGVEVGVFGDGRVDVGGRSERRLCSGGGEESWSKVGWGLARNEASSTEVEGVGV